MDEKHRNIAAGEITEIIRILTHASTWIILAHSKPDGDTLGSGSAFSIIGRDLGKQVVWGGPHALPEGYSFLSGAEDYVAAPMFSLLATEHDETAVVALDTSTVARSVKDLTALPKNIPLINIDHHHDNERYGTLDWIDSSASSVGEMCWLLFRSWDVFLPLEALKSLYVAITTDCGNFTFSCTTARTHEAAADLLSKGVSPEKMEELIHSNRSLGGMRLKGEALAKTALIGNFGAYTYVSRKDFERTGSDSSETEFLVNELLYIRSITFAVLFVEEDDCVRVSFRSKGTFSAAEVAHAFGGGGHPQAAGCRLDIPLDESVVSVLSFVEEQYALRHGSSR